MKTSNDDFYDAVIRHQVQLMRLSKTKSDELIKILKVSEVRLRQEIEDRIEKMIARGQTDFTKASTLQRVRILETTIRNIRTEGFSSFSKEISKEMTNIARVEAAVLAASIADAVVVDLDFIFPDAQRLRAIVENKPFRGRTLAQWTNNMRQNDIDRIIQTTRIGIIEGKTTKQITSDIFGKAGVVNRTYQQVETLTRTATNFYANEAKQQFFQDNSDIVSEELYSATLDSRTTPVCRSLDGNRYPLGKGPIPPVHFGCRSVRVAVIDGEVMGERPMKSSTEKQLLREFAERNNISPVGTRSALPRGTKGNFDAFARKRVRELTGRTPASTTYQEFLSRQTVEFQQEVLGVTKAKLFRKGDLKLDKFVNRTGDELTLGELANRQPQAFRKAGLDPDEFK
jgi:SPP1 gp7 family putative phage head morphogenesis protein